MAIWQDTLTKLNEAKTQHGDAVLVAFSGGKDSLVCMDLCKRTFKKVVAFHMFFVPGLACIEADMQKARERWGVEILYYPHHALIGCLKNGVFCNDATWKEQMQDLTLKDVYSWVKQETGIKLICTGAKNADSLWRRRHFHAVRNWDGMLYPLREWNKHHVTNYLNMQEIPIPKQDGGENASSGVDLSVPAVLWLHDKHPEDFKKLLAWFPYADAIVARRSFYGIGQNK